MNELSFAVRFHWRKLLLLASWSVLIVLALAGLPFVVDAWSRGIDWFRGLFFHTSRFWEESQWLH